MQKKLESIAAAAAAAVLGIPASADTYTWKASPADAYWNTSSLNWTLGGANAAWADGNDAVFGASSQTTVTIQGERTVGNLTATERYTLQGNGSLSVSGAFVPNAVLTVNVPVVGDNALRLSGNSFLKLQKSGNSYTGGTYLESTSNSGNTGLMLDGGSLGAVPATPRDDIFANSSHSTLLVNNNRTLEANRHVRIADGKWFNLGSGNTGTLTVKGIIHGEKSGGLDYPTNTHFFVRGSWGGHVVLDPGAGVTNDVGAFYVQGLLTVTSGVVRIASGVDSGIDSGDNLNNGGGDGNALCFVKRPSGTAYADNFGRLVIGPDAAVETPEESWTLPSGKNSDRKFQTSNYAQVEVNGRLWMPNAEYLNAYGGPAKLTIGDGGDVCLSLLRLSKVASSDSGTAEVNLNAGGKLRLRAFAVDNGGAYKCDVNFNGGTVHPLPIPSGSGLNFLAPTSGRQYWNNVVLKVKEGGAVFEPVEAYANCNWPLKSGAAVDGGLKILAGNGYGFIFQNTADSDYNGPTRVECVEGDSGTLQIRIDNALPGGTALQIGPKAQVHFTNYQGNPYTTKAQTVARLEGSGWLRYNAQLSVTNGVAPVFDGQYGTLTFDQPCSLAGNLEIKGDATGCGRLFFKTTGQSLANLTLKMTNPADFATDKGKSFYKVVDAPNGYTGTFAATDLRGDWEVRYEADAVYLRHIDATVLYVR